MHAHNKDTSWKCIRYRHIVHGANEAHCLANGVVNLAAHAKVCDFDVSALTQQNVVRLDVAMNQVQLFVNIIQPVE